MTMLRSAPRPAVAPRPAHGRRGGRILSIYLPLFGYLAFTLVPLYWMLVYALRDPGSRLFTPFPLSWENFDAVLASLNFATFLRNSAVIGIGTVILTVLFALMGGYALARFRFRGRRAFLVLLLCTQFVPGAMLLIPLYEVFRDLGLLNSLQGLIVANTVFQLPLAMILMSGFIRSVPVQIEEAAMIDGCGRLRGFRTVVLPLLGPALVAVSSFSFIGAWNNFLFGLMFINEQERFPVPVGLSYLVGEHSADYGALAAGGMLSILPVVLVFAYVQRHLVQGMTLGAVKG